jgi:hypothetical protein
MPARRPRWCQWWPRHSRRSTGRRPKPRRARAAGPGGGCGRAQTTTAEDELWLWRLLDAFTLTPPVLDAPMPPLVLLPRSAAPHACGSSRVANSPSLSSRPVTVSQF